MFGVDNGGGGGGGRGAVSRINGGGQQAGGEAGAEDAAPTNIMHAAYVGALEMVKSMVEVGGSADAPDLLRGSTPLHWACFGGHLDVVRWLVNTGGADVDRANNDGCTPLFFACEKGHLGVAQWLVREAGAKVNVKDNVMWQTPLHRVCLNAHVNSDNVAEVEDLILWLVEAGADLTAVDRFGNHVEDLRAGMVGAGTATAATAAATNLASTGSASKLCDMITTAREDGVPDAETREKLKRRNAVRKKSGTETAVQLSPKLEAKQRAPMSRRGSGRKDSSGMLQEGGESNASSRTASSSGLSRTGSYGSTGGEGSRIGLKKKPSGSRVVSKSPSDGLQDAEFSSASPMRPLRASGGSGGGVAAPAAGAGARMGGGPPAPAVAGSEEASSMAPVGLKRRSSKPHKRISSSGGNTNTRDDELQQQESLRVAEEALRKTEVKDVGDPATAEARRRLEGAGQEVVDKIRELAAGKKAGEISAQEFADQKRRLLEMEKLRREAEEEALRREQGNGEDAGAGILTSVGQNTPPPSPKNGSQNGSRKGGGDSDDDDETPIQVLAPTDVKDTRETYKPSDIERYTNAKTGGPRVFGEVPESVKESLAAKEAAKAAAAVAAAAAAAAKNGDGRGGKKSKGKKKRDSKNGGSASASASGGLGAASSAGEGGVIVGDMRDGLDGGVNQSSGGCKCVIM